MIKAVWIAGLLAAGLALAGCAGQSLESRAVAELSKLPYPKDAPLGEDLDIIVTQYRTDIQLNNRTPRAYRGAEVWLNQQYVGRVGMIQIGDPEANRVPLDHFVNWHGDPYPIAGLLSPEKGFPVVLAELFDPATGQRHRLVARPKR